MPLENRSIISTRSASQVGSTKPRLLFFRSHDNVPSYISSKDNLPTYIRSHLYQHIKCLSTFFDVTVISISCDYTKVCQQYEPDLVLVESGVYSRSPRVTNVHACPAIPKVGLLNSDAYCTSRTAFLSDMEHWGIETYFTISVSASEYIPTISDKLFIWPNFADPDVHRDYALSKTIPVLFTGSRSLHYPWRNRINSVIAQHFPTLNCPHFGWFDAQQTSRMAYGEEYARLINASYVVPTCGTIAKEVVRKHFEIPGCNSCLVTEQTVGLEAAGFIDMRNCVFVDETDVLDKLDYLFRNRDVLENITQAGHQLVQTQHTLKQRSQILQWLTLNKSLRKNERIVQPNPFGPLVVVDKRSKRGGCHIVSNGTDRVLLRKGDASLRQGNYDDAERCYLSCLNYHFMPEPILGLTLCSLYRGSADTALTWITQSISCTIETHKAMDPDPVEWAYFIISLLCKGEVAEATRRAHQFPGLRHEELQRSRSVIELLNCSNCLLFEQIDNDASGAARPSVHQLPKRDIDGWTKELCTMLRACQQGRIADQLHSMVSRSDKLSSSSYRLEVYFKGDLTTLTKSSAVLPLGIEPIRRRIGRRVPVRIRRFLSLLRSRLKRTDKFGRAVERRARGDHAASALILGACDRSPYTNGFLRGLQQNPCMPIVFCLGQSKGMERLFAKNSRIRFISGSPVGAMRESGLDRFEIVLVDNVPPIADESFEALSGANTILIRDINSYFGHKIAKGLVSSGKYILVDENSDNLNRYAIFNRIRAYNDGGGDPVHSKEVAPVAIAG